ncbi:MAG: antitoxin [Actinomycetota bacterium]
MRTTMNLDDDVLLAVKERARREKRTAGEVLSYLARQALTGQSLAGQIKQAEDSFYGFSPLPHRGAVVSNDLIDRIRAEDGTRRIRERGRDGD